jgi:hypothetical protein
VNNQFFYVFGQDMIADLDPIWMCWRGWLYTHPAKWYLGRQPITGFAKKKEKNLQKWIFNISPNPAQDYVRNQNQEMFS